jgi:hypothetical protein
MYCSFFVLYNAVAFRYGAYSASDTAGSGLVT